MGAWGHNNFENDTAMDLVDDVVQGDTYRMFLAIDTVANFSDDTYLEMTEASQALAAIEIMCAVAGRPSEDFPKELESWLKKNHVRFGDPTLINSKKAIDRILKDNSELKDEWERVKDGENFFRAIENLKKRLSTITGIVCTCGGSCKEEKKSAVGVRKTFKEACRYRKQSAVVWLIFGILILAYNFGPGYNLGWIIFGIGMVATAWSENLERKVYFQSFDLVRYAVLYERFGFHVNEEVDMEQLLNDFGGTEAFVEEPHLSFFELLGEEVVFDDGRSMYVTDMAWTFDTEAIEQNGDYTKILENIKRISGGKLNFENIRDEINFDTRSAFVSFDFHGTSYTWKLNVNDDWVDTRLFESIDYLAKKHKLYGRLSYLFRDSQSLILTWFTYKEAKEIRKLTNLDIQSWYVYGESTVLENIHDDFVKLQLMKEEIEATKVPYVKILAHPTRDDIASIDYWKSSRFGGFAYLPKDATYPTSTSGKPLFFLAQINWEQVPHLDGYPRSGLTQFFIDVTDHIYGIDFDDQTKQEGFVIVHHENFVDEVSKLQTDFSFMPKFDNVPLTGTYYLHYDMHEEPVQPSDYKYTERLGRFFKEKFGDDFEKVEETYWEWCGKDEHKIGGYASFAQTDPREYKKYKGADYQLLLQITSEGEIIWGDAGIANFFITKEDLKKRDFSKVLYNWDCY